MSWLIDPDKKGKLCRQGALARIKTQGVKRKLVGVEIAGDPIQFNMVKWPVKKDGKDVGKVSSATYSPRMKKNLGYVNVPVELSALGSKVSVEIPGIVRREATVVQKPFVDPKKDIPKS